MAIFVNPYNFVPFGKTGAGKGSRDQVYDSRNELKTGWLTVQMEVKTPVIIPDGAHPRYVNPADGRPVPHPKEDKKNLHKEYSFYKLREEEKQECVIPGSEIRGMLRSVYEAVTDSCLPFLMDDKPMSQRVPIYGSVQRRGLLQYNKSKDTWVLWNVFTEKKEADIQGTDIFIGSKKYYCGDYIKDQGYVQCNVPISRKNYHVGFLNPDQVEYRWEKGDSYAYDKMLSVLERDGVTGGQKNPNDTQRKHLLEKLKDIRKNGGMIPVRFFCVLRGNQKLVYLSNSSIGRIAQYRKWEDIIDQGHRPCKDTEHLCPACLLFGTTNGEGMRTRVRITDARATGQIQTETCLLDILGQPRTSAFEFYLRRPKANATYWNFDFYGIKKYNPRTRKNETEYYDLSQATPRGRKMYWHGTPQAALQRSRLNTTMECVKGGTFTFQIFFDRITQEQLDTLIWAVTLGDNSPDSQLWHKIGHAKPLGYGSVKLVVQEKVIRKIEEDGDGIREELVREEGNTIIPKHTQTMVPQKSETFRALLALCDQKTVQGKEVRYPRLIVKNDDSVYQWFSENRKNADYLKCLPEPYDKDITLKGSWLSTPASPESTGSAKTGNASGNDVASRKDPVHIEGLDQRGRIQSIAEERGFAFIKTKKDDLFVHRTAFSRGEFERLEVGTEVLYKTGKDRNGKPCAVKAVILPEH